MNYHGSYVLTMCKYELSGLSFVLQYVLSLTVKKAKNTKIIGLQFGKTNFCSYLCSNTRYYHPRVFAFL